MPETPLSLSPFQGLRGPAVPPQEERQTVLSERRPTQGDSGIFRDFQKPEPIDSPPLEHSP